MIFQILDPPQATPEIPEWTFSTQPFMKMFQVIS